ncbi:MAG: hypothetical protein KF749_05185 [Bacteroidetes bacterium]|nr:hypothetical protein [Bacteroidota bacterium]MCW5896469.1 hypothetical protein [Bacteroidota bacterium]
MKRHTAITTAAALVLSFGFITLQASAQPRRMSPDERTAELKKELNLTEKQTTDVKKIYEQLRQETEELFESSGGTRGAFREIMMKKNREADEKIIALLTKEQKKKFETSQNERRNRFEDRPRRRNE